MAKAHIELEDGTEVSLEAYQEYQKRNVEDSDFEDQVEELRAQAAIDPSLKSGNGHTEKE